MYYWQLLFLARKHSIFLQKTIPLVIGLTVGFVGSIAVLIISDRLGWSIESRILIQVIFWIIIFSGLGLFLYWVHPETKSDSKLQSLAQILSMCVAAFMVIFAISINKHDSHCDARRELLSEYSSKIGRVTLLVQSEIGLPYMCWDTKGGTKEPTALNRAAKEKLSQFEIKYSELNGIERDLYDRIISLGLTREGFDVLSEYFSAVSTLQYYCGGQSSIYHDVIWRNVSTAHQNLIQMLNQELSYCN